MNIKFKFLAFILLSTVCSSCIYKMPTEDSYSLIPKTNNPNFIGSDNKIMPNQAEF